MNSRDSKMPQSSALDRLFPEAMRYHKGRVARLQHRKSSGAGLPQLVRLSPRQKLTGIVRRSPEVMLKIGRANIRCLKHMQAAADYISRNGKLEIEDQDGFMRTQKRKFKPPFVNGGFNLKCPRMNLQKIRVLTAVASFFQCQPVRQQRASKPLAGNGRKTA